MANPSFWFYATEGILTEVQLPGPLTEFLPVPVRDRRTAWSLAGAPRSNVLTGRMRVTISLGPFNDTGSYQHLERQLRNMSAHLERGLPVSFAVDREKAWLSRAQVVPGSTTVEYGTNVCAGYNASAGFTSGDTMVVESPNPELLREYLYVNSLHLTDPEFTAEEPVLYDPQQRPLVLRHQDFFPVLYLPEDQLGREYVPGDHRLTYTLDLTLEQSIPGQALLVGAGGYFGGGRFGGGDSDGHVLHAIQAGSQLDDEAAPGSSLQSATADPADMASEIMFLGVPRQSSTS